MVALSFDVMKSRLIHTGLQPGDRTKHNGRKPFERFRRFTNETVETVLNNIECFLPG
jgi:hypothetical protein